ncbi:MAG: HAMP domain-containing histidine kinase [Magnetococcales bacterium]|nr:HAMP domain-containing histidine kinase [Magnetococcales bacterium]
MRDREPLPRRWGRRLWRRTSLTVKAVCLAALLGGAFWLIADYWQTVHVEAIFNQKLLAELDVQAQRDRILFDEYIRQQEQSVRLISFLTPFIHHVEQMLPNWEANPAQQGQWWKDKSQWAGENRPPWLPPRSVMRGLVAAPYMLLLDGQKNVRESFLREAGLPPLPETLVRKSLPDLLMAPDRTHILADSNGVVYLITETGLLDQRGQARPNAFLVLVAPLDNDFLTIFHSRLETSSAVAFIHGESDRVFASSLPGQIPVGTTLAQLEQEYVIFGKRFLDYSFAINVPIHFATLVPRTEIQKISDPILQAERKQRTIGFGVLSLLFLSLVLMITRGIHRFTRKIIETAVNELELEEQRFEAGDQLLILAERFQWMTQEIIRARQQENKRQLELQNTNDALHQSLVMIKRAQSRLVEAEKMASLGSLVAGVAHEINTPVGTGLTAASFLAQKAQECADHFANNSLRKSELERFFQDVLESTQMILQNLQRAAELVRSFKQVAVDRANEEQRTFRMQEYIHHVLLSLRPRLKQTQHEIQVVCPTTLEITSYPGAFSQIISNFIVNSLMHGFQPHEKGKIVIEVVEREGDICLRYSDNGHGMEESDRLRIFEPFFTTARNRGGSGLGMHIVFNLVTQTLKGTILCQSSPGQGTTYEIDIPK